MAWGMLMTAGFLVGMLVLWIGYTQQDDRDDVFVIHPSEQPSEQPSVPRADFSKFDHAA